MERLTQPSDLARSTAMILRQITGASLALLLILGWVHDRQASLEAPSAIWHQLAGGHQWGARKCASTAPLPSILRGGILSLPS